MNPMDDQLNRLFRAANKVERVMDQPPYGLETRVMAAWRSGSPVESGLWDIGLLTRGLIAAILLMGVSFLPVLNQPTDPQAEYLQLADTTIPSDITP